MTADLFPSEIAAIVAHESRPVIEPDCCDVALAERADQANLMALEALLSAARRSSGHIPLATLIRDVQAIAAAVARATTQLIDSLDCEAIEREVLALGALALQRYKHSNHPGHLSYTNLQ